ncbi:hypothetical protein KA478_04245 [Patescibacteria group bacterium]|nr:hypothetical protein [Patescibacteria group bacterium]
MQSNLTKIDLPNAQSICYHQEIDGKDFFWKEYKPFVSQSALEVYHAIHAAYGKTRRVKNLDCHLPFGEKEMNRLSYVILPLPDDLQVASTLQNKSEALVTQPQYVSGMTLDEWLQEQ